MWKKEPYSIWIGRCQFSQADFLKLLLVQPYPKKDTEHKQEKYLQFSARSIHNWHWIPNFQKTTGTDVSISFVNTISFYPTLN